MPMSLVNPAGTAVYTVDPAHSSVEFSVKHLGITTIRGTFADFEGTLELGRSLDEAKAYGTVLAAEQNPRIEFRSTEVRQLAEETLTIAGELTMRGVTRPIELVAEIRGTEVDPWGNERVALEVTGRLNRRDWDMTFSQVLGSGNAVVSDKVSLQLSISAVKQQSADGSRPSDESLGQAA